MDCPKCNIRMIYDENSIMYITKIPIEHKYKCPKCGAEVKDKKHE